MQTRKTVAIAGSALALVGLMLIGLYGAVSYGRPFPMASIQDLGGIMPLGASRDPSGSVRLQLACDLSGLETITVKPRTVAHFGGVESIDAAVEGNRVYVTVNWAVGGSASAPPVDIGPIPPGSYEVLYRSPQQPDVPIGTGAVP